MSSTWVKIGTNHSKIKEWAIHGWKEVQTNKKSSTWVRIATNHSKIKQWAIHGWKEVRINKKSSRWVGTHPQLSFFKTPRVLVLYERPFLKLAAPISRKIQISRKFSYCNSSSVARLYQNKKRAKVFKKAKYDFGQLILL